MSQYARTRRATTVLVLLYCLSVLPLETLIVLETLELAFRQKWDLLPHPWPFHDLERCLCSRSTRALPLHVIRSSACRPLPPFIRAFVSLPAFCCLEWSWP